MSTTGYLDEWIICPSCRQPSQVDGCDVGGADEGNAFCPRCTTEFDLASAEAGDPVECLLGELEEKYPLESMVWELREAIEARGAVAQGTLFDT